MKIRLAAVIIEDNKILLLDQDVNEKRAWSLPGGKLEENETLEAGLIREVLEETGLIVRMNKLLYVCDNTHNGEYVLHMTFLARRTGGTLGETIKGLDVNPIRGMEFVPISDLQNRGFGSKFQELAESNFPGSGSYMGPKSAIGL